MIYLLALFLLLLPATWAQAVSLASDKELAAQRNCVVICISGSYDIKNLWNAVGDCKVDSCFCRQDLRPVASSHLNWCINTAFSTCSNGVDYRSAASIYDRYCTFTAPATVEVTATASRRPNDPITVTRSAPDSGITATVGSNGPDAQPRVTTFATVTVMSRPQSNSPAVSSPYRSEWLLVSVAGCLVLAVGIISYGV